MFRNVWGKRTKKVLFRFCISTCSWLMLTPGQKWQKRQTQSCISRQQLGAVTDLEMDSKKRAKVNTWNKKKITCGYANMRHVRSQVKKSLVMNVASQNRNDLLASCGGQKQGDIWRRTPLFLERFVEIEICVRLLQEEKVSMHIWQVVSNGQRGPIGPGLCQTCPDLGSESNTCDVKKHFLFSTLCYGTQKVCVFVVRLCN